MGGVRGNEKQVRACVERAQEKLSGAVYGHKEPKEKILQILSAAAVQPRQWRARSDPTARRCRCRLRRVLCAAGETRGQKSRAGGGGSVPAGRCQWMANPDSTPLVLGIQGPPGNGKTTLSPPAGGPRANKNGHREASRFVVRHCILWKFRDIAPVFYAMRER